MGLPDAVVSMSQYPQQAGAAGSSGVGALWLQGVVAVQHSGVGRHLPRPRDGVPRALEDAGALHWSCPPHTAPLRRGWGSPEDPRRSRGLTQRALLPGCHSHSPSWERMHRE